VYHLLKVTDEEHNLHYLPLVDIHTHIGRVKIATTKGSSQRINQPQDITNLYQKLQYEIAARVNQNEINYYVHIPKVEENVEPLFPVIKSILSAQSRKARAFLVDKIVTFPFNDIFHTKTDPKFVKSNRYVRHQVNTFDNTFRFTPFCRVDPTDLGAANEVQESIKLGMYGLKLHPLSQGWIDKIKTPETKKILQTAGNLHIPVIFDVPNKGVALDITTITQEARQDSENPVNVILGHTGFDYSSSEIFECLSHDGMYAETSGMRGKDVEIFFNHVMEVPNWEKKLLFGTDHNYFSVLQATDVITFLLSKGFQTMLLENEVNRNPLAVAFRILGANALEIIPVAWNQITSKTSQLKYKVPMNFFQQFLKKFITTEGNYLRIDLGYDKSKEKVVQILSLGKESSKISFIIYEATNQNEILLQSVHQSIQKVNYDEHSIIPLLSTQKSLKRAKKLSLKKLQAKISDILTQV
jgi:predicted TIM-barrel fold metal-dependent hydrolase